MAPNNFKQICTNLFAARTSVEEGATLASKFDTDGLIPCITTDAATGEVLMLRYMNRSALERTIAKGEAYYWSRACLWHKGAISGLVQKVVEMRVDDDQDAVWLRVQVGGSGASCHVGYRSCFYPSVSFGHAETTDSRLHFEETTKLFEPTEVYGGVPNPTRL